MGNHTNLCQNHSRFRVGRIPSGTMTLVTVRESVKAAISLLSVRDRRLFWIATAIQMSTALLDLIGVVLLGLVGALAVATVQSQPPPSLVESVASFLGLRSLSNTELVLFFSGLAAVVLLVKSVTSSLLMRRVFRFLANRQALISSHLSRILLAQPLTFIHARSSQETSFALISGTAAAVSILGHTSIVLAELALLVLLGAALIFASPWVGIGAVAFFLLVAVALQRVVGDWAHRVGIVSAKADIASTQAVQEAMGSYREITVSNRQDIYATRIGELRWEAARVAADAQFIGTFPKYLFEAALVIGGLALAGVLFATQESAAAVGTLALFLAAGSRVMPSVLRLQGSALSIRSAAGQAEPAFSLIRDLGTGGYPAAETAQQVYAPNRMMDFDHDGFIPHVVLQRVCMRYPGADSDAVNEVSIEIPPGSTFAIVGRSGSGKSTLADLILGVLSPNAGSVSISSTSANQVVRTWPGALAYVPQDVRVLNGTVRSNVALGLPDAFIDDEAVRIALTRAHLHDFLRLERSGLDTAVGEFGVKLSGGQRQRLGIARALYTNPKVLVLDEATSALDAETESLVTTTIRELSGQVTIVAIAHRLATVAQADQVLYLDQGRAVALGTFDQVRTAVPAFDRQAELLGMDALGT